MDESESIHNFFFNFLMLVIQLIVVYKNLCVENKDDDYVAIRSYCTDSNDVAVGLKAPLLTARSSGRMKV